MAPKRKAIVQKSNDTDAKKGKADLEGDLESEHVRASTDSIQMPLSSCKLDSATQDLIDFIFEDNMFIKALQDLDVDMGKLALDKITIPQIHKGFDVLEKLEEAIKDKVEEQIEDLSSKFYDIVPHDPSLVIGSVETVQEKYDLLNTLADVEIAQRIQRDLKDSKNDEHPLDAKYNSLGFDLQLVDQQSQEYKLIAKYISNRRGNIWRGCKMREIWSTNNRQTEENSEFADLSQRMLLWYGTNPASTAAILKNGLHIKPHSGGQIGRLLFADTVTKAAFYSPDILNRGILFLYEVALCSVNNFLWHFPCIGAAPTDFTSFVREGTRGPDKKKNVTIQMDGKDVIIPVGKEQYLNSQSWSYSSEYFIFREEQYKLRYIVLFDF